MWDGEVGEIIMEVFSEEELGQEVRGTTEAWKLELWVDEVSYPAGREITGSILSHRQGGI